MKEANLSVERLETRETPTGILDGLLGSGLGGVVRTMVFPTTNGINFANQSGYTRTIYNGLTSYYSQLPSSWLGPTARGSVMATPDARALALLYVNLLVSRFSRF
jgi:hypothetical protein